MALTRAKYGLVVLGNARVLARQALWNALLAHFKEEACLVEGPLQSLRQSLVQLPAPKTVWSRLCRVLPHSVADTLTASTPRQRVETMGQTLNTSSTAAPQSPRP